MSCTTRTLKQSCDKGNMSSKLYRNSIISTLCFQLMLWGNSIGQPDSIKALAQEASELNNKIKRVLPVSNGLSIQFRKGSQDITIINDTNGNLSSAWSNKWYLEFESGLITKASYWISSTEDYNFQLVSGFEVEFISHDTLLVNVTRDDCYTFVDSIKWKLKTYPIRVSHSGLLVAVINKNDYEVFEQDFFTKHNHREILAVLKEERFFDSEDSIYLD